MPPSPALIDTIGLFAGALTTVAFVPQFWKTWRSRSARDISLGMFVLFTLGVALWLVYGLLAGALPVIAANTVTLVLALAILVMKLRYG
jgi:MtN3 and saliva related transmembrane protein